MQYLVMHAMMIKSDDTVRLINDDFTRRRQMVAEDLAELEHILSAASARLAYQLSCDEYKIQGNTPRTEPTNPLSFRDIIMIRLLLTFTFRFTILLPLLPFSSASLAPHLPGGGPVGGA